MIFYGVKSKHALTLEAKIIQIEHWETNPYSIVLKLNKKLLYFLILALFLG